MSTSSELETVCHDETYPIVIAIMGPTGTGKTSLINLLSGSDLRVGRELESCTSDVQIAKLFDLDGHMISLIDTPGFDDTNLSATSVLNMIAAYLSFSYDQGHRLAGVIYMHRILDNRVGGISARSFRMFRHICGEETLSRVVITTSMWDRIDVALGEERERELIEKDVFFKPAIEKGARLARHDNTLESAQAIIRTIVQTASKNSVTLKIQDELRRGVSVEETQAGKEIGRQILEEIHHHRVEVQALLVDIQEATKTRDHESRQELVRERARLETMIQRLERDSENMAKNYSETLKGLEERLRLAEQFAISSRLHSQQSKARDGLSDTSEGLPPQTHSPVVQAVAATENSNAVLEGKLAAAIPVLGFWGKLSVMLAPFSLTWK